VIVIDAPHSMAASRLKVIPQLHLSHEVDILIVDLSHHLFEVSLIVETQLIQTPAEKHE